MAFSLGWPQSFNGVPCLEFDHGRPPRTRRLNTLHRMPNAARFQLFPAAGRTKSRGFRVGSGV